MHAKKTTDISKAPFLRRTCTQRNGYVKIEPHNFYVKIT